MVSIASAQHSVRPTGGIAHPLRSWDKRGRSGLLSRPIAPQKGVHYTQANSVKSALPRPAVPLLTQVVNHQVTIL